MPKIFLSHSRVDQPKLKQFAKTFEASPLAKKHNLTFWLDAYDIDNFDEFPEQIEEAIHNDDTCAFVLHLSKAIYLDNGQLRPWIKTEVSLAKQRKRADDSKGKPFSIVPFTLFDQQGTVEVPRTIALYNTHSNVYENNRLNNKTEQMIRQMIGKRQPETTTLTSSHTASDLIWLSFEITQNNGTIQSICLDDDDCDNNRQILNKSQLLPFKKNTQSLQRMSKLLLGNEQHTLHCINQCANEEISSLENIRLRIRVVTDDPELAMLPWHFCCDKKTTESLHKRGWIIELTPPRPLPRPDFVECSLNSPLIVIPANDEHIVANQHRSLIESYLQAHLDIQGETTYRKTPEQLKMALEIDKPDLIYIGAYLHQRRNISLDKDFSDNSTVTLNKLADWIEAAQIHPVLMLNFIGQPITEYPKKLINVCKLVWIQHVKRPTKFDLLPAILEKSLQNLCGHQNDLLASIVSQQASFTEVDSHLWVKGRSFQIKNDVNRHQAQQLRAALLRVMLGRDDVKATIYNQVSRSQNLTIRQLFVYTVTGTQQACPFDVPAQIRQRLQWEDPEKSLPVLPLEFDLDIDDSGLDALIEIDKTQAGGLGTRKENESVQSLLEERLDQRGLRQEECCISLNWFIKTNNAPEETIVNWLQEWYEVMHDDFIGNVPDNKVLLIAACLQVDDETQAQVVQDKINQLLRESSSNAIRPIRHAKALGRLDEYEISDFFNNNPHWHSHLKLDEHNIDINHYTNWILQQTKGQFEETVCLIWQQYQRNYQNYS